MEKICFATAAWARNEEERNRILDSVKLLSSFNLPISISIKEDPNSLSLDELKIIPNIAISGGKTFFEQRINTFQKAAELGERIFWLESDKKDFIQGPLKYILERSKKIPSALLIPYPDEESFSKFPEFQRKIESALNLLISYYVPGGHHFTYGPILFPSILEGYLRLLPSGTAWGMVNAFVPILASIKNVPIEFISVKVNHDSDVQDVNKIQLFRLKQMKEYISAVEEVLYLVNNKNV